MGKEDTGETCAKDPAVSLRIQNVHYPTTSVKDMHTSRGWTGQLLALGDLWRMRQTQHYGILRTREGKSLRTRSDVPQKYAPVTKRLIVALWKSMCLSCLCGMKRYILAKTNHILSWSCKCSDEFVLGDKLHKDLKRCSGRFFSCVLKLHWEKK